MKLRNKKTGEIITLKDEGELALLKLIEDSLPNGLNVWEEVKEPLIKDEKIRKAVRAWADASGIEKVTSYGDYFWVGFVSENTDSDWKFECNYKGASEFKHDKEYTIAELCGEDEE